MKLNNRFYRFTFHAVFVIFVAALLFLPSCSTSKPEISFGFIQLVLYQSDSGPQEHFSFFIIAEDEDGLENLEELYLYHDKEQLCWQITSEDWVSHTENNKNWIGTRSLSIKEGSLPRGVFRAVLVNKGGESTERNFTYDGNVRFPFPTIEINSGFYTVNSQWPVNRLVCYDRNGNYTTTINLTSLSGNVSQLRLPSGVISVALWAEDESNFCSAFTNAVSVN